MKKLLSVLLAIMMLMQLTCCAWAEEAVRFVDKDGVAHDLPVEGWMNFSEDGKYTYSGNGMVDLEVEPQAGGTVVVEIDGDIHAGLFVVGDTFDVTVSGNVNDNLYVGNRADYDPDTYEVLSETPAQGNVSIDGDVHSCAEVYGEAVADIDGDVNKELNSSFGVYAANDSQVNVGGNAYAYGDAAIIAKDNAKVNVEGSAILTTDGTEDENGEIYAGMRASDQAEVSVNGITAECPVYNDIQTAGNANVTVNGDITGGSYGIYAAIDENYIWDDETGKMTVEKIQNESTVTVNGDVNTELTGVWANGKSDITVNGDITVVYPEEKKEEGFWYNTIGVDASMSAVDIYDPETDTYVSEYSANESTVEVNGNINASTGVAASGEAQITVNGDITADETGVLLAETFIGNYNPETDTYIDEMYGNNATVIVNGNITSDYQGIYSEGQGNVTVNGNVDAGYWDSKEAGISGYGVIAREDSTVVINGDVTSDGIAAIEISPFYVWDDELGDLVPVYEDTTTTVTVNGDINALGNGLSISAKADVTVTGDVNAEMMAAINIFDCGNASVILIGGDVNANFSEWPEAEDPVEYPVDEEWLALQKKLDELFADCVDEVDVYQMGAIQIRDDQTAENTSEEMGSIVILGSVNAMGDGDAYVVDIYMDENQEIKMPELPTMTVYELNSENGDLVDVNVFEKVTRELDGTEYERLFRTDAEDEKTTIVDAIAATIRYIIDVIQPENGTIEVGGDAVYDETADSLVAGEGDDVDLTFTVPEGYVVDGVNAGTKATVTRNADGTWTVTVQRGGGVTISANIVVCSHQWETVDSKPATCTEAGYANRICSVCGLTSNVTLSPLGHDYPDVFHSNGNGTHSAVCEHGCGVPLTYDCDMSVVEFGTTRISTCKVCAYSVTEEIEADATEAVASVVAPETEGIVTDEEVVAKVRETVTEKLTEKREGLTMKLVPVKETSFEDVVTEGDEKKTPLQGTLLVYAYEFVKDELIASGTDELVGEFTNIFNIALVSEGQNVTLDRTITVRIPMDDEVLEDLSGMKLVLIAEDGTLIEIPYEIVDGQIVFDTSYLGIFAFVEEETLQNAEVTE